jgi:hypothetical protein
MQSAEVRDPLLNLPKQLAWNGKGSVWNVT